MTESSPTSGGLAKAVEAFGWPDAIDRYAGSFDEGASYYMRWALSGRHVSWKGLFSPAHRDRIVVLDRGWGTSVITLAGDFRQVDALYSDTALMRATQARAAWLGLNNINFRSIDETGVSLPPASFDAAALCELTWADLTPALVRVISQALRPHGRCFISITGTPLRLRTAADAVKARRSIERVFFNVRYFRYREPVVSGSELVPLQAATGTIRMRVASVLAPFRSPALAIIADKEGTPGPSLFEEVVKETERATGREAGALTVERYLFSNPQGFTLRVRDRSAGDVAFVKIPFHPIAERRMATNYTMLETLRNVDLGSAVEYPRPLAAGTAGAQPFFVESAVPGEDAMSIQRRHPEWSDAVMAAALDWITRLHQATAREVVMDKAEMSRLVEEPMTSAFDYLSDNVTSAALTRIGRFITDALAGTRLNLVLAHGDFTPENVLLVRESAQLRGVFDWDLAEEHGLPLLDPLYYILTSERALHGSSTVASTAHILVGKLFRGAFSPTEDAAIKKYCEAVKVPAHAFRPLVLMVWLSHLGKRMHTPERYRFARRDWYPLVEAIAGEIS